MRTSLTLTLLLISAGLVLSGCDRPGWSDGTKADEGSAAQDADKATADPLPKPPEWLGKIMAGTEPLPQDRGGKCDGNSDLVLLRYTGQEPGAKIFGWGWDISAKARVDHVVLLNPDGKVIGGGEGGVPRPDVVTAKPTITDPNTGWYAYTSAKTGSVSAFGIVGKGSQLCPLGHLDL